MFTDLKHFFVDHCLRFSAATLPPLFQTAATQKKDPPVGGGQVFSRGISIVSIHATRTGSDNKMFGDFPIYYISIHATLTGSDNYTF